MLDHFDYQINERLGGIDDGTGKKVRAKIALLGGADLVETFCQPGVWAEKDLTHILCDCMWTELFGSNKATILTSYAVGAFIIERAGTDLADVMTKLQPAWRENIHVIHQVCLRWTAKLLASHLFCEGLTNLDSKFGMMLAARRYGPSSGKT